MNSNVFLKIVFVMSLWLLVSSPVLLAQDGDIFGFVPDELYEEKNVEDSETAVKQPEASSNSRTTKTSDSVRSFSNADTEGTVSSNVNGSAVTEETTGGPLPYWETNRIKKEAEITVLTTDSKGGIALKITEEDKEKKDTSTESGKGDMIFAPPPEPKPEPKVEVPVKVAGQAEQQDDYNIFSFYKKEDEKGGLLMTDHPVEEGFTYFQVKVHASRGLSPARRLNFERVRPFILLAAQKYKVDPALVTAIIKAESAFDPKAVSWAGARGLMQLMPRTAILVGCQDSFDPQQNIMGGTKYIGMMLKRFNGNVSLAVAAYNCGPERVAKNMSIPNIMETQNYVRTVLRNYENFKPLF